MRRRINKKPLPKKGERWIIHIDDSCNIPEDLKPIRNLRKKIINFLNRTPAKINTLSNQITIEYVVGDGGYDGVSIRGPKYIIGLLILEVLGKWSYLDSHSCLWRATWGSLNVERVTSVEFTVLLSLEGIKILCPKCRDDKVFKWESAENKIICPSCNKSIPFEPNFNAYLGNHWGCVRELKTRLAGK